MPEEKEQQQSIFDKEQKKRYRQLFTQPVPASKEEEDGFRFLGSLKEGAKDVARSGLGMVNMAEDLLLADDPEEVEQNRDWWEYKFDEWGLSPDQDFNDPSFLESVVRGVPQVGSMIAAHIVGGPALAMATIGSQIGGGKYNELAEKDVEATRAAGYSIIDAMSQGALEYAGFNKLMRLWKPQKLLINKIQKFGEAFGTEAITEYAQAYPDAMTSIFAENPDLNELEKLDKTLTKFATAEFQKQAGYEGLVGGTLGGIVGLPAVLTNNINFEKELTPDDKRKKDEIDTREGIISGEITDSAEIQKIKAQRKAEYDTALKQGDIEKAQALNEELSVIENAETNLPTVESSPKAEEADTLTLNIIRDAKKSGYNYSNALSGRVEPSRVDRSGARTIPPEETTPRGIRTILANKSAKESAEVFKPGLDIESQFPSIALQDTNIKESDLLTVPELADRELKLREEHKKKQDAKTVITPHKTERSSMSPNDYNSYLQSKLDEFEQFKKMISKDILDPAIKKNFTREVSDVENALKRLKSKRVADDTISKTPKKTRTNRPSLKDKVDEVDIQVVEGRNTKEKQTQAPGPTFKNIKKKPHSKMSPKQYDEYLQSKVDEMNNLKADISRNVVDPAIRKSMEGEVSTIEDALKRMKAKRIADETIENAPEKKRTRVEEKTKEQPKKKTKKTPVKQAERYEKPKSARRGDPTSDPTHKSDSKKDPVRKDLNAQKNQEVAEKGPGKKKTSKPKKEKAKKSKSLPTVEQTSEPEEISWRYIESKLKENHDGRLPFWFTEGLYDNQMLAAGAEVDVKAIDDLVKSTEKTKEKNKKQYPDSAREVLKNLSSSAKQSFNSLTKEDKEFIDAAVEAGALTETKNTKGVFYQKTDKFKSFDQEYGKQPTKPKKKKKPEQTKKKKTPKETPKRDTESKPENKGKDKKPKPKALEVLDELGISGIPSKKTTSETPVNRSSEKKTTTEPKVKRAKDFQESGEYEVNLDGTLYKIYRDQESGWWYQADLPYSSKQNPNKGLLGFNKQEALQELARLHSLNKSEGGKKSTPKTEAKTTKPTFHLRYYNNGNIKVVGPNGRAVPNGNRGMFKNEKDALAYVEWKNGKAEVEYDERTNEATHSDKKPKATPKKKEKITASTGEYKLIRGPREDAKTGEIKDGFLIVSPEGTEVLFTQDFDMAKYVVDSKNKKPVKSKPKKEIKEPKTITTTGDNLDGILFVNEAGETYTVQVVDDSKRGIRLKPQDKLDLPVTDTGDSYFLINGEKIESVELIKNIEEGKIKYKTNLEKPDVGLGKAEGIRLKKKHALKFKHIKNKIKVVGKEQELPLAVRRDIEKNGYFGRVTGVVYGDSIYVVSDNIATEQEFVETMIHEARHLGINHLMGNQGKKFFSKAALGLRKEVNAKLKEYGWENTEENRIKAAEEIILDKAETNPNFNWFTKLVQTIKSYLRQKFPNFKITDLEIQQLVKGVDMYTQHGEAGIVYFHNGLPLMGKDIPNIVHKHTYRDNLIQKFLDKMRRIKTVQKEIERLTGKQVEQYEDPYLIEELHWGATSAKLDKFNREFAEPIYKKIGEYGLNLQEIGNYLYAKHAIERNHALQEKGYKGESGTGLETSEALAYLESLSETEVKQLEEIANLVYKMNRKNVQNAFDNGLITEAQKEGLLNTYKYYVPLKGEQLEADWDAEGSTSSLGRGYSQGRWEFTKRAKGRESIALNPLTQSIVQAQEAIVRGEKNKIGKAFLNLVRNNIDTVFDAGGKKQKLWELDTRKVISKFNKKNGKITSSIESKPFSQEDPKNVIVVLDKGKRHYIKINDPAIARAMNNLGAEHLNTFLKVLNKGMRGLAKLFTTYNPEFMFSNFVRDLQTAIINMQGDLDMHRKDTLELGSNISKDVIKSLPKAFKGIYRAMRNKDGEWAEVFNEYRDNGGMVDMYNIQTYQDILEDMQKQLQKFNPQNDHHVKSMVKKAFDGLENMNLIVENATRLSVYKNTRDRLIKKGVKPEEAKRKAASVARNITVNFNRKGEYGSWLNSLYLFYNATVQGNARLLHAMGKSRKVRRTVGGLMATSFAMSLMNGLLGGEDEDGIPYYDKINPWIKQNHIIFMIPGTEGKHVSIPVPYGYNIFHTMGTVLYDMNKGNISPMQSMGAILGSGIDAFNPLGSAGSWYMNVFPSVLRPGVEVLANENFMGAPIYPEKNPFYKGEQPDSQQYFKSVSTPSKGLAFFLNKLTGGNEAREGLIDISPEVLDHWFDFAGGGGVKFINNIITATTQIATPGKDLEVNNIPIMRRFLKGQPEYYTSSLYRDARTEIATVAEEFELAKEKGFNEKTKFRREHYDVLKLRDDMKSTENSLKQLYEQKNKINANTRLNKKIKRDKIKRIDERIKNKQKVLIRKYNKTLPDYWSWLKD